MNAFEVEMDNYIADYTKKNSTKPDYEPITNKDRYYRLMFELIFQIRNTFEDVARNGLCARPVTEITHSNPKCIIDDNTVSLYSLKRGAPKNNFQVFEGYDIETVEEILNKTEDKRSDKEKEIIAACDKKEKVFNNYLESNFTREGGWMWQRGKNWKHGTVTDHRFQLAVKPSVEVLEELKAFADKYDCKWKCPSRYLDPWGNDWIRVDSVDIYTKHPDIEGQKRDLAEIVAKYGYGKDHGDRIDRFFESERIADGAYMAKEWTRKDIEELIKRAKKLDDELAEYGTDRLKEYPTEPSPMSAGMYEAFRTSINTYEAFVDFIGGLEKAKEPVIPTKGATRAPSKSAAPAPAPAPAPAKATIIGSGATSKTAPKKIVENPFEKMSDADLAKALAAAKDGTYWKFGLTVEQKRREAKKAGEDVSIV